MNGEIEVRNRELLLVEDESNLRSTMAHILRKAGFMVETAVSQPTARQQLQSKQFNLLLLDLDLSGDCGLALLSEVRTFHSDTQIVILSAQISTIS
jgi:DNA-binding response OmpR family regulator